MLQQTQVKTVLPYFTRWLTTFPTLNALANADIQDVLKAWEGLGYYARARNLHQSAQIIVEKFGGIFPERYEDAIGLPGIGRTTAGGILSSAFGQALPIMDGNVKRVLARMIALEVPPNKAIDRLWHLSQQLVEYPNPQEAAGRDFNQAFMDLGATLCTPKNPSCEDCPWMAQCKSYNLGIQHLRPMTEPKRSEERRVGKEC